MAGNQSIELSEQYVITPKTLLYDNNLTPLQRLIMIELLALSHRKGYAYCRNSRLAKIFELNSVTISRNIKILEQKGYISCEYEKEKSNSNRTITINSNVIGNKQETINSNVKHPYHLDIAPLTNELSTLNSRVKHNNKSNNKTNIKSNNKKNIKKENPKYDEKVETLRNIFKEYYSSIGSRFTTKKVKEQIINKKNDFEEIEKGFKNYLDEKMKDKTKLEYIKSTHLFIRDEMYKDYLESDSEDYLDDYQIVSVEEYINE